MTFDTALSMEWLNNGQLVQKYAVEVFRDGAWVKVAQAQAIGHMKIDHFPAVTASRVRLNILSSVDAAHIRVVQRGRCRRALIPACGLQPKPCPAMPGAAFSLELCAASWQERWLAGAIPKIAAKKTVRAAGQLPSPPGRGVGGEGTARASPLLAIRDQQSTMHASAPDSARHARVWPAP
ncbi:hypothetical protein [uncultured Xanthomonas sp.]|uniref:hypothetical protein n=1 Tax=uncultured Xanthomonas sp. TaxID=152831 RepID=UPI0025FABB37|nr:hypothetical protein [uncultured Xanthomonas sp.]